MLTPIEIQSKVFKSGMGYTKRQVDDFLDEICDDYELLYKENMEMKDKVSVLSEGIQYYKTIEKTLQKALILAEKASEETKHAASMKASSIEKEAHIKANMIVVDAKNQLNHIYNQTVNLIQHYEKYKIQMKQLAASQIELLESDSYKINSADLDILDMLHFEEYEQEHRNETKEETKKKPQEPKKEPEKSILKPERKSEKEKSAAPVKKKEEFSLSDILERLNQENNIKTSNLKEEVNPKEEMNPKEETLEKTVEDSFEFI